MAGLGGELQGEISSSPLDTPLLALSLSLSRTLHRKMLSFTSLSLFWSILMIVKSVSVRCFCLINMV